MFESNAAVGLRPAISLVDNKKFFYSREMQSMDEVTPSFVLVTVSKLLCRDELEATMSCEHDWISHYASVD